MQKNGILQSHFYLFQTCKKFLILLLFFVVVCSLSPTVFGKVSEDIEELHRLSEQQNLANDDQWLKLLHFESRLFRSKASAISTKSFFLSKDGHEDAQSELFATISSFVNVPQTQCRFPARLIFLSKRLPHTFPRQICKEYDVFLNSFSGNSVSLVYASGYLGNPASMFGHVFIKFNKADKHELLDNTFNFGAIVPKNDNKLTYIIKGISGGYQGHYANQKYHHHTLSYSETELRDLWEYELNLSASDVSLLLAHLWELENTTSTYYFFDKNCAYQLAKLLELVINKPLVTSNKSWVMPYDLIMMLAKGDDDNDVKLIKETIYHGSRQEELYKKYRQLNEQEKLVLKKIIKLNSSETEKVLNGIGDYSVKRIIDVMYDYFAFLEVKNEKLSDDDVHKKQKILSYRFQLSPGQLKWQDKKHNPPHTSQNTALLQFGGLHNDDFSSGVTLRFRANYYDLLSVNSARIPHSELSAFDLTLLYVPEYEKLSLRELTLFNIVNLNASQTDLDDDNELAWKFSAGYKPQQLSCVSCSALYLEGFVGKSWSSSTDFVGYAGLTGRIQSKNEFGGHIYSGPELGGVFALAPSWVMSFEYGHYFYLNDIAKQGSYLDWEQRFFNDQSFDVRTRVRYEDAFEYAINFSYYW